MTLLDLVDRIEDGVMRADDFVWMPGQIELAPATPSRNRRGARDRATHDARYDSGAGQADAAARSAAGHDDRRRREYGFARTLRALVGDYIDLEAAAREAVVNCMLDAVAPFPLAERIALYYAGFNLGQHHDRPVRNRGARITEGVEACGELALGPPQTAIIIDGVGLVTVIGGQPGRRADRWRPPLCG